MGVCVHEFTSPSFVSLESFIGHHPSVFLKKIVRLVIRHVVNPKPITKQLNLVKSREIFPTDTSSTYARLACLWVFFCGQNFEHEDINVLLNKLLLCVIIQI